MDWSCPHCSLEQSTYHLTLKQQWTLIKCVGCSCFSLVKKQPNKAKDFCIKPIIKPGKRGTLIQADSTELVEKNNIKFNNKTLSLPDPLPLIPEPPHISRQAIPMIIGAAFSAVILLGGFIFSQNKLEIQIPENKSFITSIQKEPVLFDRVSTQAMAPSKNKIKKEQQTTLKQTVQLNNIVTPHGKNTNVRAGPSGQHKILTPVQPGLKFIIKGFKDNWLKVSSIKKHSKTGNNLVGWVREDLLTPVQN